MQIKHSKKLLNIWERHKQCMLGANEMPIRHLIKLSDYYQVSLDYLCGRTDEKRMYKKK